MDTMDYNTRPEITEGYAVSIRPVKWKPYKPNAQTRRKGRWQKMNEYAGWENCREAPAVVLSGPAVFKAAPDMLDALKQCQAILADLTAPDQRGNSQALYAQCRTAELASRAAIAKAEGAE